MDESGRQHRLKPMHPMSSEAVQKVLSVMLNEVKHPFFRTNKWILQSLRSFRMTFSLFWDNLCET